MIEILTDWFGIVREIFIMIDSIAFSLIDNAYNLYLIFAKQVLIENDVVEAVMKNMYVAIGIFALFRIALLLVNSMINPDKLNEKGNGIGNILTNLIIMFVLLVMTPTIFEEALKLQSEIVEGNYIQKILIKDAASGGSDPAKEMQDIAITALVHPNEEVEKSGEGCDDENSKCGRALKDYEDMQQNGFSWWTLRKHISVTTDTANEKDVYVYDYTIFVTFAAGVFITYVLISFAFDVAIRSIELAVLEVIAPLFIATIVDPKSAKSGPFKNWLKAFGKSYVNLFIIIASVSLLLLFIGLIGKPNLKGLGGWGLLVMLFAVLIFFKKLPKWFGGLIGIEGSGLSGLGIGKKLAGAALIGGLATKAGHAAVGMIGGGLRNTIGYRRGNRERLKNEKNTARERYKNNLPENASLADKARAVRGTYFSSAGARQNLKNMGSTFVAGLAGTLSGAVEGAKTGVSASDLKDVNAKLKSNQKELEKKTGYQSIGGKISESLGDFNDKNETKFFTDKAILDAKKENLENKKKAEKIMGRKLFMNDATGDLYDTEIPSGLSGAALTAWEGQHLVAFDSKTIKKRYGSSVNGIRDVIASTITNDKDAHFLDREISNGQTYEIQDPNGRTITMQTSSIGKDTLVKNKVDASGNVIYDVNGNAVKEVVTDNRGNIIKTSDSSIKEAIKKYEEAAKAKGAMSVDASVTDVNGNSKRINLTGQGVLEYEASFAELKDQSARAFVSINDKKGEVSKQLAELQSNLAATSNNLEVALADTEYGKAKIRKNELDSQIKHNETLQNQYRNALSQIDSQISATNARLRNPNITAEQRENLTNYVAMLSNRKNELATQSKTLSINNEALRDDVDRCNTIMSDATNINDYNAKEADLTAKTNSIRNRIDELLKQNKEYEKELENYIGHGNVLSTKEIDELTSVNADRFLETTAKIKDKTRKAADEYEKSNKDDSSK